MNGIDRISRRLVADAEARIAVLNAETAEKCEAILNEYRGKAKAAYDARMQEGDAEREIRMQRLGSTAEMEAKKAILAFKQEMIGQVFDNAVEKLVSMPKEQYVQFLAALAAKAAERGTEELIFNARDAAAVGRETVKAANALLKANGLPAGLTLSEETREIPGGVIVRQGNIETNCAADTLIRMSRSELAPQVAEILFD